MHLRLKPHSSFASCNKSAWDLRHICISSPQLIIIIWVLLYDGGGLMVICCGHCCHASRGSSSSWWKEVSWCWHVMHVTYSHTSLVNFDKVQHWLVGNLHQHKQIWPHQHNSEQWLGQWTPMPCHSCSHHSATTQRTAMTLTPTWTGSEGWARGSGQGRG